MQGLVILHLNYANAIMAELPDLAIKMFQWAQNMAAKLVLERKCGDSASECWQMLHWLPIRQRDKTQNPYTNSWLHTQMSI